MNRANLITRLLFAAWAAPLGWVLVNWDRSLLPAGVTQDLFGRPDVVIYPGALLAIAVVFLACYEYLTLLRSSYPRNGFWLAYLWLGVQCLTFLLPRDFLGLLDRFGRYDTYILLLLVALESVIWGRYSGRWKRASLLFIGMVFLSVSAYSLVAFYHAPFQSVFPRHVGPMLLSQLGIVVMLAATFLCDSAAYFVGSLWGRHHYSSISPNKTIEGAAGGLAAALLTCGAGWYLLAEPAYPWALGLLMGLLVGVFAQLGDLVVSLMKRYFQVKDASNLIPGHGGALDRFGSLFFVAPILNLFFIVVEHAAR